jgi:hypothetical protein
MAVLANLVPKSFGMKLAYANDMPKTAKKYFYLA